MFLRRITAMLIDYLYVPFASSTRVLYQGIILKWRGLVMSYAAISRPTVKVHVASRSSPYLDKG